jgi:hypothetical protein
LGDDDDDDSDDGEDAALAFYAADGAATVDGDGVEVSVNEMLLGGRSGTVTLSDSLSRAARVGAANVAGSSAAPAPAPAPAPPVHSEMALFNLWLAEKQSAAAAAAAAATLDAVAAAAPAPAPAPAPVPAAPVTPARVDAPPPAAAPSSPSYMEIRAAVAALTPTSPIATVRATATSLQLGVKTNLGGAPGAARGTSWTRCVRALASSPSILRWACRSLRRRRRPLRRRPPPPCAPPLTTGRVRPCLAPWRGRARSASASRRPSGVRPTTWAG